MKTDFSLIGYTRFDEVNPETDITVECIDGSGIETWVGKISEYIPTAHGLSWRPVLSKDELWEEIVRLGE